MTNNMRPIHPGEILKDELETLSLSARAFASHLHVPTNRITTILNEERAISSDTALRLARYFGTSPQFWLNLQMDYDLKITARKIGKKIDKEVHHRNAA